MKTGDLVKLENIHTYQQWEFWPLSVESIQKVVNTKSPVYGLAKFYAWSEIQNFLLEIIYSKLGTSFVYSPIFDAYTHIWTDCLRPLELP